MLIKNPNSVSAGEQNQLKSQLLGTWSILNMATASSQRDIYNNDEIQILMIFIFAQKFCEIVQVL